MPSLFERIGFTTAKPKSTKVELKTFQRDQENSSGTVVDVGALAGGVNTYAFGNGIVPTVEKELIKSYRELANYACVDEVLQEIRNEVFVFDERGKRAVELSFIDSKQAPSKTIQKRIIEEYHKIYGILDFHTNGIRLFDEWFIDGKIYLHKIVDNDNKADGIQKVVSINPLDIRLFEVIPERDTEGQYDLNKVDRFYIYSEQWDDEWEYGRTHRVNHNFRVQGLRIPHDAIAFADSGKFDRELGFYVGYLKKAIIPFNNLRMMEEAMAIFRVARAPARRAFYIDVTGMQKTTAEQYMKRLRDQFNNNHMVYDAKTGKMVTSKGIPTMLEDYWLPRRNGTSITEIETIQGQDSQQILEEVQYFREGLWRALGVPISRFNGQSEGLQLSRMSTIQRDEYRFRKYLSQLRQHFMKVFDDVLHTQLVLKKVITADEWEEIKPYMTWEYTEDNSFVEFKETELISSRLSLLRDAEPYVGKYLSAEWVRKNILRQTEADISYEDTRIAEEKESNKEEVKTDGPPDVRF